MHLLPELSEQMSQEEGRVGLDSTRKVQSEVLEFTDEALIAAVDEPPQEEHAKRRKEAAPELARDIPPEAVQEATTVTTTVAKKTEEAPDRRAASWVVKAIADILRQLSQAPGGSWRTTRFDSRCVPSEPIDAYAVRLHEQMCCSPECFVFALIYLDRYLEADNGRLSVTNVHRLFLTSLRVSTKVFDDHYRSMRSCAASGGLQVKELVSLESCFLRRIGWRVYVAKEECDECLAALACLDTSRLAKAVRHRPGMAATEDVSIFVPGSCLQRFCQAQQLESSAMVQSATGLKLTGSRKVKAAGSNVQMLRLASYRRAVKTFRDKAAMPPSASAKLAQKKLALLRSVKVASRTAGETLLRRNLGERWRRICSISLGAASHSAFHAIALLAAR